MITDLIALASEAELALRSLVSDHGQTSLAEILEHVRQYRVRLETRAAVEAPAAIERAPNGDDVVSVFMCHGKACRVVRTYVREMPVESLVSGFVFAGVQPVEVADIVYLSDWKTATVRTDSLREIM